MEKGNIMCDTDPGAESPTQPAGRYVSPPQDDVSVPRTIGQYVSTGEDLNPGLRSVGSYVTVNDEFPTQNMIGTYVSVPTADRSTRSRE
jgi:hypothetical protein